MNPGAVRTRVQGQLKVCCTSLRTGCTQEQERRRIASTFRTGRTWFRQHGLIQLGVQHCWARVGGGGKEEEAERRSAHLHR